MAAKSQTASQKASPKASAATQQMSAQSGGMTPELQKPEEATPMTPKNFRNHPDMENFFRFIYENDLRFEALGIIDEIISARAIRRAGAGKKGMATA